MNTQNIRIRPRPFLAAALAVVLGLPLFALAHANGSGPGKGHWRGKHAPSLARVLEKNAARLNLDATTLARINEIEAAQQDRVKDMRERSKQERAKLHDMLQAETPSEGAVMAQVDVLGDLRTDLQKERVSTMLQIRALLTPEQKAELAKIRAERREKIMKHRQERMERRKSKQAGPEGAASPLAAPQTPSDGSWF
jgi:Spy/CpxP family protein refolding chaperone